MTRADKQPHQEAFAVLPVRNGGGLDVGGNREKVVRFKINIDGSADRIC